LNKIFTADNIVEVGLVRSFLEQNDIPSELRNHPSGPSFGLRKVSQRKQRR